MAQTPEFVTVLDRYTRDEWWRKIGDGPWKQINCSIYPNGKPPIVFFHESTLCHMTETLMSSEEVKARASESREI